MIFQRLVESTGGRGPPSRRRLGGRRRRPRAGESHVQPGVEDLPCLPLDRHLRQPPPGRRAERPADAQVGRLHLGYVACVARERRVVGVASAVWKGGSGREASGA